MGSMRMRLLHVLAAAALVALASSTSACALDADTDTDGDEPSSDSKSELGGTKKKTIDYFVQAHPDDEIAGWSLIQRSGDRYPVFIMLTQGEETSYCNPSGRAGNERELGEAAPPGNAYEGKWSRGCREARVQSWHRFLDAMADYDPSLSKPPFRGTFSGGGSVGSLTPSRNDDGRTSESRSFAVYADERSARVVFDLGDGDLTPEEVTWAIQSVRQRRRSLFPRIAEGSVVAVSYRNVDPRCAFYDHHDHRSVHVAIYGTNQGTPARSSVARASTIATSRTVAASPSSTKTSSTMRWASMPRSSIPRVTPTPSAPACSRSITAGSSKATGRRTAPRTRPS
jgi:hypothetical protein